MEWVYLALFCLPFGLFVGWLALMDKREELGIAIAGGAVVFATLYGVGALHIILA